jgi:hypothetical protein
MARKKKNPLQAQLEKDISTFKKNTSLKKGYENVKRETKRAVRELTSVLDLPKPPRTSKQKNHSYVAGKSSKNLSSVGYSDFNKMTKAELRAVVSRLADTANKRVARMKRAGISTPALRHAEMSGGKFSTKGKDINALRAEYARVKGFLEAKTSTQSGWREVKKNTITELKKQGINVTQKDFDRLWETYEKLKEVSPDVASRQLKYSVLKDVSNAIKEDKTPDEIATEMTKRLSEIYEEQAELMDDGVSGFFEI